MTTRHPRPAPKSLYCKFGNWLRVSTLACLLLRWLDWERRRRRGRRKWTRLRRSCKLRRRDECEKWKYNRVFLLKRAQQWYGWFENFSGDGDFLLQVKVTHCHIFPSHELVILHSWAVLLQLLYFTWPAWKKDCLLTFLQFYSTEY